MFLLLKYFFLVPNSVLTINHMRNIKMASSKQIKKWIAGNKKAAAALQAKVKKQEAELKKALAAEKKKPAKKKVVKKKAAPKKKAPAKKKVAKKKVVKRKR